MGLTRHFKDTVQTRAARDAAFRKALLTEALDAVLDGDLVAGKALLRDYVNATLGFEGLAKRTGIPTKSLHRMLGRTGNPTVANFAIILEALAEHEDIEFQIHVRRKYAGRDLSAVP
ncbi:MAG: transcriptional regulator [Gammaproteobacteria bacterium]|nr:transcriptional regulator [Gammaproteobacteria bacterium]